MHGMQRLIFTVIVAFAICLALGPVVIPLLKRLKFGQMVRDDGPQTHLSKAGTPTMGGVMMMIALLAASLFFMQGNSDFIVFALAITIGYGVIGMMDDGIKIARKRSLGLKAYQKIIGQLGLAIVVAIYAYNSPYIGSTLWVPFFNVSWDLGIWYIPFTVIAVIAIVNAVNLTDGLDGLASGVTLVYCAAFAIIYYYAAHVALENSQDIYAANLQNMMVYNAAVTGACLGFLRFNAYPAKVFMGDSGAFALGAAVVINAIMLRATLIIFIMGAIYVVTALSVMLQVGSYKLRKKRIFRMAPLHHHFELMGINESRIVTMYVIAAIILALIGLLAFAM